MNVRKNMAAMNDFCHQKSLATQEIGGMEDMIRWKAYWERSCIWQGRYSLLQSKNFKDYGKLHIRI